MKNIYSKVLFVIGFSSVIIFLAIHNTAPLFAILIFKSLPTLSMLIWMLIKKLDKVNWPIFAGILASLMCDVFMALDIVTIGMGCNMLALIFYTIYFFKSDPGPDLFKVIPFIIIFTAVYIFLYNYLGDQRIPVLIYCILYTIFLWRASARLGEKHISIASQLVCFAGCISMATSDIILSLTLFNVVHSSSLYIVTMILWWLGLFLLMITAELKKQTYLKLNLVS